MYLFINNDKEQCGVYQYGLRLYSIIKGHFDIEYVELGTREKYDAEINKKKYHKIILNYHPFIYDWYNVSELDTPNHYYIYHDGGYDNIPSERILHTDPTATIGIPLPRPLQLDSVHYTPHVLHPKKPIIGSFGFGFDHKNFDQLIELVQFYFDTAFIRLIIPYSYYCDINGMEAKKQRDKCFAKINKPGIQLEITHTFITNEELITFLGQNDLNIFLYDKNPDTGCSSVIDYALCVNRPIAISDSEMFRHIYSDHICVYKRSLIDILNDPMSYEYLQQFQIRWSHKAVRDVFMKILE
jgi:hypothetical protein